MSCPSCGDKCSCGNGSYTVTAWQPTTTLQRGCELVNMLLGSQGCEPIKCPNKEICRLFELECNLCGGKYPVGVLAMLVAARLLEAEALRFARKGNVKTLTVQFSGVSSAKELREIADKWRQEAKDCFPKQKFAIVATGRSCLTSTHLSSAYSACGCLAELTKMDAVVVNNCTFDCCDDCTD